MSDITSNSLFTPLEQENYLQLNQNELDDAAGTIQSIALSYLHKKYTYSDNNRLNILKQKIHDILFDNQETIPEGIYLQLMDAIK